MTDQPLIGKYIAITRAEAQAGGIVEKLRALGAEPILCPAIAFAPPRDLARLDAAIANLEHYDWLIVTSANGVQALFDRMGALGRKVETLKHAQIGAIGPATGEALAEYGVRASFMPTAYVAESILTEIGDVSGKHILLPRADIARAALADGLRERGAIVDEVAAYHTVPGAGAATLAERLRADTLDAITFTSSSTVRYMLDGLETAGIDRAAARDLLGRIAVICIGPITAATAEEEGLRVDSIAHEFTAAGVVAAVAAWFTRGTARAL